MEDVVKDGATGLLVPPDDARALAAALVRILGDPRLAARLGTAARDEALRCFAWDRVAAVMLDRYGRLLDPAGKHP
jgi:glycosyltransferase involved in cell wall biosynthesis